MELLSSEGLERYRSSLLSFLPPENIVSEDAALEASLGDGVSVESTQPFVIVYPENTGQVQSIVRLSRQTGIPLVPVSSGPPHFNGGTTPAGSGVIIDFTRMDRIIEIDEMNRCVMIEPGVTFRELVPRVAAHGLKLNIPLLERPSKSVVAAYLEREPVLMPKYQYDYMDPLLTMGIVYGTGDEMRTGSASGPGDLDFLKADKVNPWGPGPVDYYRLVSGAQGTMGLVTWAMIKAEVLPAIHKLFYVGSEKPGAASALVNELLRKRIVDECLILNSVMLAMMLADETGSDYQDLIQDLPPWVVIVGVAGYKRRPEERVSIQERYLADACKEGGLKPGRAIDGAGGKEEKLPGLLTGTWTKEPYWKLRRKSACRDIFFLTPISKAAGNIELMRTLALKHNYSGADIGCYIQPMVQGRGCHIEFLLPFDESDTGEAARTQTLFQEASEALFANGAFFSRPYGPWAEMVYSKYPDGAAALKKLKNIFDPDNILNPGKLCF